MQREIRPWEYEVKKSFHNYTVCMMVSVIIICATLISVWVTHFSWIVYAGGLGIAIALEYVARKAFERTMNRQFATVEQSFWHSVAKSVERNIGE